MPTPTADVPEQVMREAFDVNVFAPFLLTGLIAPTMAERGARRRGQHRLHHRPARRRRFGGL